MKSPILRVVKRLGAIPVIAACSNCSHQFKVPTTLIHSLKKAEESLREQFERHKCKVLSQEESGSK